MTDNPNTANQISLANSTIVIVGGYGSGKSEVAVNLARQLAKKGTKPVAIADLDIVNPYFRSRQAAEELARLGVKSLVPPGAQVHADLPIIIPDIKGAIERNVDSESYVILDVGGDDVGARVLSSLANGFTTGKYELLLVLNGHRPFTADVAGACQVMEEIETSSRLKFTGIISNTHLMDDTTEDTVLQGLALSKRVSEKTGLPVVFFSATSDVVEQMDLRKIGLPVLKLNRSLLKPWERRPEGD